MTFFDLPHRSRERRAGRDLIESSPWAFREACIGSGVALAVASPVPGAAQHTPR